jgi:hypothetical protein
MKSKTKEVIISEIRQTKTVYEKLLISLTTPTLLTIFNQLFGKDGEFSLSDKGFDSVVEELEFHDQLPETTEQKITDASLVELFTDFYSTKMTENTKVIKMPAEDEQSTSHLTLDDLLDLLNIAMKHNDIQYANELKRRLIILNRGSKNSIETS